MEYTSQIRVESKACAGVVFTILAMGWKRRAALRKLQASTRARITGLRDEMAPLSKAYDAAVRAAKGAVQPARDQLLAEGKTAGEAEAAIPLGAVEFGALQTLMDLSAQVEEIDREELTPQAVRFCLVGIDGLAIDGEPATFELLLERGPDELYHEIAHAVASELGLLPEEAENLGSPSTSAGVVDGSETPGTAKSAAKLVTITSAVVPSSTGPASASVTDTA